MAVKKITVTEAAESTEADTVPYAVEAPEKVETQDPAHQPVETGRPKFRHKSFSASLPKIVFTKRRAVFFGLVIVLVIVGIYFLMKPGGTNNPLPKSVKQKVNFTLYYPSTANGYSYLSGSDKFASGKLTYTLSRGNSDKGGPAIRVSEQSLPGTAPDLSKLPNFSVFQAPAGQAAVGVNGSVVNGILIANKTIVILNGLAGATKQDVTQTINNMKP